MSVPTLPNTDARYGTVLVVDDMPEMRYILCRTLRRAGFDTREAETGAQAIERAGQCDLVVLDVNLPDMNGFEVCKKLRDSPGTAGVPILQRSTTRSDDAARVFGLESGADAYLAEPIAPEVLVATARALVRMRSAERDATAARLALHTMLEATSTGHLLVDSSLCVRESNPASRRWNPRSKMGCSVADVLPEPAGRELQALAAESLTTRTVRSAQLSADTADGRVYWRAHTTPINLPDGKSRGAAVTIEDLTAERLRYDELRDRGRRAQLLSDATYQLNRVQGVRDRIEALLGLIVPAIADAVIVESNGHGQPDVLAVRHVEPRCETILHELRSHHAPGPQDALGVARVFATGSGQFVSDVSDATWAEFAPEAPVLDLLRQLAVRSYLALPLVGDSEGARIVMSVMTCNGRQLDDEDADLITALALRAGVALESAHLYEREHRISATLQAGLLPATLPDIPGLDASARYLPAADGQTVGGDFYDLFASGDGWVAVMGDVCGKGPEAAHRTALVRHTIRAVCLQNSEVLPSEMMTILNQAILAQGDSLFATVMIAALMRVPDGFRVRICGAGHPPALQRAEGSVNLRSSGDPLVGILVDAEYRQIELILRAGESLTLYTDGVTEAGRVGSMFGEERLIEVVRTTNGDARALVDAVGRAVLDHDPGVLRDDVALLCLRVLA